MAGSSDVVAATPSPADVAPDTAIDDSWIDTQIRAHGFPVRSASGSILARGPEGSAAVAWPAARYAVCGVDIAAVDLDGVTRVIVDRALAGLSTAVHLCNAYTLSLVAGDARLAAALGESDLNLPDGTPVAWLGRRHGVSTPVRGADLVRAVAREGIGLRHYFYGGADGVADEMATKLQETSPHLVVAGTESPAFGMPTPSELDLVAARVTTSGASVVWVGFGTPRQDYVTAELAKRVSAVVVPVGAAFDFIAGRVAEAPERLRGTGLEWVYRLTREPGRLWRRYLFGNARFLLSTIQLRDGRPRSA